MTTKNFSIDISSTKDVKPSGERISGTTWSPEETLHRDQEIAKARLEEIKEQERLKEETNPTSVRLARLEGLVSRQQKQIDSLLKLLGKE